MQSLYGEVPQLQYIELVPDYLLPPECQKKGWCLAENTLGISFKTLCGEYAALCQQGAQFASPSTTFISILCAPESVSAYNSRKRMCLSGAIDPQSELDFCALLLRSHLFRHCKSPFLWHHRRWLISTYNIKPNIEVEWGLVKQAAEHHPKNYFAFTYLRWFCNTFNCLPPQDELRALALRNLSDVSVWSFVGWSGDVDFAKETNSRLSGHEAVQSAART